jgi:hypothetical protein
MIYYRTKVFISFDYCLDSLSLIRVIEIKDLSFLYVPLLDFQPHIDFTICKALRVLGFIRRHSSNFDSSKCLSVLYCSLVRSLLEYGAVVWSPYTLGDMRHLDRIQNRFLNFASYRLNIPLPPHDYSIINNKLNLKYLTERRNIFCCNFINGLIEGTIDAPRLLEQLNIRIPRCTRSKELFYLPTNLSNFAKDSPLVRMMSIINKLNA